MALWADSFYKSKCPSVCPSVCLCVCVITFEVSFNGLFAPTSQNRMSNIFRDSESLGKSNGNKWSQIWTFLFENCLKSPRKKKFFSSLFLVFLGFWSFLMVFLPPLPEVGCPIFLEIRNPWGKVMERSGLRYEHFCLEIVENCVTKKSFFSTLFHFFSTFFGFRSFLTVFLPPLPKVGYPIFLEIRNPWGKEMERSGLRYEHFSLKIV